MILYFGILFLTHVLGAHFQRDKLLLIFGSENGNRAESSGIQQNYLQTRKKLAPTGKTMSSGNIWIAPGATLSERNKGNEPSGDRHRFVPRPSM